MSSTSSGDGSPPAPARAGAGGCDLSVCIVGINHVEHLRDCLASLFEHRPSRYSFEVILVDNGSTDGTAAFVEARYPAVQVIRNPVPSNFSQNYNLAMRAGAGRYFLVLNPDTVLHPKTLDALLEFMEANAAVGASTCRLLYPDGTFQENCRRFPRLRFVLASRLHALGWVRRTRALEEYVMARPEDAEPKPVDYVLGALMLLRAEALRDIGMFDERFLLYAEDTDLCYRMWQGGWHVYYVPGVSAIHVYARAGARRLLSTASLKQVYTLLLFYAKHRGGVL